ncbi:MAG: hypothetical protein IKZ71_08110 [Bacteroidales bacterium]|nr:hypothetical protein [Bacteroidales bacterium]
MKKFFILLVAFTVSAGLYAQKSYSWAWPDPQNQCEVITKVDINDLVVDPFRPFDDNVGFALYGSRYRKAKHKLAWGNTLLFGGSVLSASLIITGINSLYDYDFGGAAILSGSAFLISSIWGGIHLWKKGRREIDSMMDDYVRQYAPAPKPNESSLNFGPTSHGVGLSLNF